MQDRLSLMLDSMMFAVDEGFSYDGIVSIPELGLEDFGHRPGLAGWLDDGVELFRTTTAAISGFFHKPPPPVETPHNDDKPSEIDSGIGSGEKDPGGTLVAAPDSPSSQIDDESSQGDVQEVRVQPASGATDKGQGEQNLVDSGCEKDDESCKERLPRKKTEQPQAGERLPRKQVPKEQEILPRKRVVTDGDQRLPSEQSAQVLEDIAPPNIGQNSPTPVNEDANHPSSIQQERYPRKKD